MFRSHLVVLLLSSSMLAPVAAHAADANDRASVEEVVVTAQRRAERLEDVPISVSAFTPERMESAGINKITDLSRMTPGLRFEQTSVFVQPTVRGIGSTTTSAGAESNVATYVDGFYLQNALGNVFDLSDVESVQVLKGPQGTLFGRNATGGAILITTKAPSFTFSGDVKAAYGSYEDMKVQGFVTGPITDWLAASLSVYHRYTPGYVKNIFTGAKNDGEIDATTYRVKFLFQPIDAAKVTLTLEHDDANNPLGAVQTAYNGDARAAFVTPRGVYGQKFGENAQDFKILNHNIVNAANIRGEFKFGDLAFNSYTGYRAERANERADLDASSLPLSGADWIQVSNTFTQEFTLAGDALDNRLNWITGAYYFHNMSKDPYFRVGSTATGRPPITTSAHIESDAYSLFADGTYGITDKLFLSLGGRWTTEHKEFTRKAGGVTPVPSNEKRWSAFTPRAVLRYEVADNTNVYASFSQGFKSGAYNASSTQDVPVNPEKLTAYEVGAKTAQGRFRLDGAVFYYDYKDLQFTSYDYTQPTNPSSLRNAARLKSYGADFNGSLHVTDALTVSAGGAYTHSEYTSFRGAPGQIKNPLGGWIQTPVDASGKTAIRTPRWTGYAGLSYKHDVGYGEITFAGNYYYSTRVYFDVENRMSWKPTGLLDANISWTDPSQDWKVSIYGSNLTDEHYPMDLKLSTFATVIDYAWPRTVGASIQRKF